MQHKITLLKPKVIVGRPPQMYHQVIRLSGSGVSATAENSPKRAKEAAQANCKKHKAKSCELQALFDRRNSGLCVHDFGKPSAP